MTIALGVDGGGTQTRCLVIDEQAKVLGFGVGGASKPDAVEFELGRTNLQQAILKACESFGGPADVDTVFLGMGGVVSEADSQVIRQLMEGLPLRAGIPVGIDHDIRIALAGGTAGKPGIALIVGTGSSSYGRNSAGQSWRSGGWGFMLDDLGSGYYLGQQALIAVVRAYDGRGPKTTLHEPILEALGVKDINEVMHRIYHPRADYGGIAALAPIVTRLAESDPIAMSIIERGCAELAIMVEATAQNLKLPENVIVVPVGGLTTSSQVYRQALDGAINHVLPKAQVQNPFVPAVAGAVFLALEQAGITLSEDALKGLQNVG